MTQNYRIRIKQGEIEVEAESTDQAYVSTKIDHYLAILGKPPQKAPIPESKSDESHTSKALSVGEFIRQVDPNKKNEVAATLAYYLEYHENKEEWRPDDVAGKFTDVRKLRPANMTDLLTKSNFFMKGHEIGFYRLSETGVQWVEERRENAS